MRSIVRVSNLIITLIVLIALSAVGKVSARNSLNAPPPPNVDVSQRAGNESEEAIAVNPTNPNNIVIFTNIAEGVNGMFLAVSFDGGTTWTRRIVGEGNDVFGDTCCDPSAAFDQYGNLFLSWLYNVDQVVPIALSTDGGLNFSLIATISAPDSLLKTKASRDERGLFRFVDQETVTTGANSVWVVFNAGGPIFATGAPVTGLGQVGPFFAGEVVPGTNNCTYGDVAIGPQGQVMNACNLTESGQGGGKVFINVDPDGLGPAGFGDRIFVAATHVGGFDFIAPQPDRSVDAEAGLAWDRTGGQFMPKISLDQTTGNIAVMWYDSRADLGTGGSGDTDGIPNTDAQFWGSFSTNGTSFTPNFQVSAGTSNSHVSGNHIDYGDYDGLSFYGGMAHPAWSDNSNSTGDNPDGTLNKLDIYTAAVPFTH